MFCSYYLILYIIWFQLSLSLSPFYYFDYYEHQYFTSVLFHIFSFIKNALFGSYSWMSHRTFIESSTVTTAFWLDQYGGHFASIFRRCPPSKFWGQWTGCISTISIETSCNWSGLPLPSIWSVSRTYYFSMLQGGDPEKMIRFSSRYYKNGNTSKEVFFFLAIDQGYLFHQYKVFLDSFIFQCYKGPKGGTLVKKWYVLRQSTKTSRRNTSTGMHFYNFNRNVMQLQMLLFPNALCCSLYERNCVCAVTKIFTKCLPANNFCQLLRVTRKRSCHTPDTLGTLPDIAANARPLRAWIKCCLNVAQ